MSERRPLISVIVPIYQIERYLGICIESIIKQTYANLEIILVDDGSPDRCGEICDLYAKKDGRIRVIHKENGGLVSARKAGLAAAAGEYVNYVDGDDWIEPGFIEALWAASGDADLVIAGQSRDLFQTSSRITGHFPAGSYAGAELKALQQNMLSCGAFFQLGVTTYVWNKLFRRQKLMRHQNAVDNRITIGEDAAVVYPYLMDCSTVRIIANWDYHYRQREDSMLKQSASFQREAVGLKLLRSHLLAFADRFPWEYRLEEQVTDYLLGICIMHSGGILPQIRGGIWPYSGDFYGKKIVVASAGTFGQQLVSRIRESGCCTVVGWVDEDYWEYRRCCLDVDPPEDVGRMHFDCLLLATVNQELAAAIKQQFLRLGVPQFRILTVNCPPPSRKALLESCLDAESCQKEEAGA